MFSSAAGAASAECVTIYKIGYQLTEQFPINVGEMQYELAEPLNCSCQHLTLRYTFSAPLVRLRQMGKDSILLGKVI